VHLFPALHVTHAVPPVPQTPLAVPNWQAPLPSQQPAGQLVESHVHTPATHSCPDGHTTHAPPLAPHSALAISVTQVVPLQHPVAQSAGAQYATHA
jgi:hypothetical protein